MIHRQFAGQRVSRNGIRAPRRLRPWTHVVLRPDSRGDPHRPFLGVVEVRTTFPTPPSAVDNSARASFRTACSITAVWLIPSVSDKRETRFKHSSESRKLVG